METRPWRWVITVLLIGGGWSGHALQGTPSLRYPGGIWDAQPRIVRYDLDGDGKFETIAVTQQFDGTLTMEAMIRLLHEGHEVDQVAVPDHFTGLELVDLNYDRHRQIVVWSEGGAHCTNLRVMRYQGTQLITLFEASSAAGIEMRKSAHGLQIWIGREHWQDPNWSYATGKPLMEVYGWDGTAFMYRRDLSTAPQSS